MWLLSGELFGRRPEGDTDRPARRLNAEVQMSDDGSLSELESVIL